MLRIATNLLRGRPILAIFDVTKICNQRCSMCNVWKTKSEDMSLAEIEDKAQQLSRAGVSYVFLQGGEPTLRKDLLDIIDLFLKYGIKPTVISNGMRLTDALAEAISVRRCNLAISIDSLEPAKFARLRGVDKLEKVAGNIKSVAKYTKTRKGNWALTTTVSNMSTLQDVKRIEAFAQEHGFMFAIRPYVTVTGVAGKQDDEMAIARGNGQCTEIFEYMYARSRQNNFLAGLIYREHLRYLRGEPMDACDALKYSILLQENGRVSPCIEMPHLHVDLTQLGKEQRKHKEVICNCNRDTPCFYNDAREVGILMRNKWSVLLHAPQVVKQLSQYGQFF